MGYDFESSATIVTLLALIVVYLYILLSPSQPHVPDHKRNFVIPVDTLENFKVFTKGDSYGGLSNGWDFTDDRGGNSSYIAGREKSHDDFFLFEGGAEANFMDQDAPREPIVPSENFHCGNDWIMIRSQLNYKFLWMHTANFWMAAGATIDTPMHHKAFKLSPVNEDCSDGWVALQEGDSSGFIFMVPQNASTEGYGHDEWVIKTGTDDVNKARNDTAYHFLVENEGFVLNRRSMAFLNVISNSEYAVRGHSSGWGTSSLPAMREYGATMQIEFVNASIVEAAIVKEDQEEKDALEQDKKFIAQIQALPTFTEKRVISFGLYGKNPKYTIGAIHNMEAAKIYFPGWVCRFYVTSDVPEEVVSKLKTMGAEIVDIPPGKGYISGMFWRFLVAADPTVDRYIIRDSDSRMNARDRLAVEEWIESKYAIHIMRDHVNHCLVMNGGMWGGVKGALSDMKELVEDWESRDEYAADLNFLEQKIWPKIKHSQIAHDSYCCDRFPNARPFPSKRPMTYQHVGQVFDEHDHARLNDIDGYIRGVPVPGSCRKVADWIYG